MSSKEITLITTALSKFTKEKKNLVYLGVWCHPEEWNNFNSLKKKQIIKYHWNEFNKRLKDDRHLKKIYEQTLIRLSSKLNKSHNVKKKFTLLENNHRPLVSFLH